MLESGWVDDAGYSVQLPATLPYQQSGYQSETVLLPENDDFQFLLFSAKYLNVRLFLDGKELVNCLFQPEEQNITI